MRRPRHARSPLDGTSAIAAVVASAGALAACTADLPQASSIERTRVLGARVEIDGAPGVAWPAPGETGRVSVFIAEPAEEAAVSFAMAVCPAATIGRGISFCNGAPIGFALEPMPRAGAAPAASFAVPPAAELGRTTTLLAIGVVCAGGSPVVSTDMEAPPGCDDAATSETTFTFEVPIRIGDATNLHPNAEELAIRVPSRMLDLPPLRRRAARTGCATDAAIPRTERRDGKIVIEATGADASLETYTLASGATAIERLTISTFATAGKVDAQFGFIDTPGAVIDTEIDLTESGAIPADGLYVGLYYVVRDGRGGQAMTERGVCVTP